MKHYNGDEGDVRHKPTTVWLMFMLAVATAHYWEKFKHVI